MILALAPYIGVVIFVVVFLELLFATYLDITTGKFPNKYFLIFLGINFALLILLRSVDGLLTAFITVGVAVLLLAPIYLIRILAAGDIKLILSVSMLLFLDEFVSFLLMSFIWAGVFGLLRSLFKGEVLQLFGNTLFTTKKITVAQEGIPFTVGILLGWCSYKTFLSLGYL